MVRGPMMRWRGQGGVCCDWCGRGPASEAAQGGASIRLEQLAISGAHHVDASATRRTAWKLCHGGLPAGNCSHAEGNAAPGAVRRLRGGGTPRSTSFECWPHTSKQLLGELEAMLAKWAVRKPGLWGEAGRRRLEALGCEGGGRGERLVGGKVQGRGGGRRILGQGGLGHHLPFVQRVRRHGKQI